LPITRMAHRLRSEEIKDLEVKRSDIADGAINSSKIEDLMVSGADLADGSVTQVKAPFALAGTVDNQSSKEGTVSGAPTDALGTQSIDFTHSAFPNAMDSALSILEGLTDTGAELDNIRIREEDTTPSGATITYEVKTSGAAGSNAAFRWLSIGH